VLIAALVVGQILQSVSRPYLERSVPAGQIPIVAATALAGAVALAIVVIVFRVRLGGQILRGVRDRSLRLAGPESLPARYAIADPPGRAVLATLALVDLALLLLIQGTFHTPVLSIADDHVTRQQATVAYVAVVVLVSLLVLLKLYRTGAPVLVLLLWWGLDRRPDRVRSILASRAPSRKSSCEAWPSDPRTVSRPSATFRRRWWSPSSARAACSWRPNKPWWRWAPGSRRSSVSRF
jgi:hypothetical protein